MNKFKLQVLAADKPFYEGECYSLVLPTTNGEYGILANHCNMLGAIIPGVLRVNLDGNTNSCIYEVKTHKEEKEFKVSKQYWRQAQVEMYASGIHNLYIVAYALQENDYKNFFNEIDTDRIQKIKVDYDEDFIQNEYLPRLEILTKCLKEGVFPCLQQQK